MKLERRRVRSEQTPADVLEETIPMKVAMMIDWSSVISSMGDLVETLIEVATVAVYFQSVSSTECNTGSSDTSITHFPLPRAAVTFNGIMSIYFCVHFFWTLFLSSSRWAFMTSMYSWIALLTVVTMALSYFLVQERAQFLGIIQDGSDEGTGEAWTLWAPSFLRIWWAHRRGSYMVSKYVYMLHPAIKEIVLLGSFLIALLITSTGFFQFFDSWGVTCIRPFDQAFYLIMVTITTLGYGDSVPRTNEGRAVIVLIIFAAMFFLPVALGKMGELGAFLRSQNSYSGSRRHIVVCGSFDLIQLKVIIQEFAADPGTMTVHAQLSLVLVTPEEFTEEMTRYLQNPSLRGRVTVCVSNALRKGQIRRYAARAAEAVVLFSPRNAVAQRGDFDAMMKSIVFHRYEPQVPLMLLLRRGMHADAVRRTANVIFERERLKFHLMGITLRLPLFVPFLVNLLKSTDLSTISTATNAAAVKKSKKDAVAMLKSAITLHASAMMREIRGFVTSREQSPSVSEGRRQHPHRRKSIASSNHSSTMDQPQPDDDDVTDDDDDDEEATQYNDDGIPIYFPPTTLPSTANPQDDWWRLYLRGASCRLHTVAVPPTLHARLFSAAVMILETKMSITAIGVIRQPEDPLGEEEVLIGQLREKLLPSDKLIVIAPDRMDSINFVALFMASHHNHAAGGKHGSSGGVFGINPVVHAHAGRNSSTSPHRRVPVAQAPKRISQKTNAFPFHDHVLLIDLAASDLQNSLNAEEKLESDHFQALDVIRLLRHVIDAGVHRDEHIPVVLLSGHTISPQLSQVWPEVCRPIYHVRGYGTESGHLATVRPEDARAIVLFYSTESAREDATVHLVAHVIHEMLVAAGRDKEVPVIMDVDDMSLAYLVSPRVCPFAEEERMNEARSHPGCAPSFYTGRVIASTFIDTIVFQSLGNSALPEIILKLMGIEEDDGDVLDRVKRLGSLMHYEAHSQQERKRKKFASKQLLSSAHHHQRTGGRNKSSSSSSRTSSSARGNDATTMFSTDTVFGAHVDKFLPTTTLPHELENMTYGELVAFAVRDHCIPLGLRRFVTSAIHGARIVGMPLFITNPPTDTKLLLDDELYYLSTMED